MTLQDYINLSQNSINSFFSGLGGAVTNIVFATIALIVGVVIGYILKRIVVEVLSAINFEKTVSSLPMYQMVVKSHESVDLTTFLGELVRWIAILVFLVPAVSSLQVAGAGSVVPNVLGYLPSVILASLYLLIGFVVAWFVHRVIEVVAVIVGYNPARVIGNVSFIAIVVFVSLQALAVLQVPSDLVRIIVIASIAASALAVGLGGRDQAADLLKRFMDKGNK